MPTPVGVGIPRPDCTVRALILAYFPIFRQESAAALSRIRGLKLEERERV